MIYSESFLAKSVEFCSHPARKVLGGASEGVGMQGLGFLFSLN